MRTEVFGWSSALLVLACLGANACAQTKTAPAGGDCFEVSDCAEGLICAVQNDGRKACTNDLTNTTKVPNSGGGEKDAAVKAEGGPSDAAIVPDAPAVKDSAPPVDAVTPQPDAAPDAPPGDAQTD